MSAVDELFAGISGRGWKREPWEVVREARAFPGDLADAVVAAVDEGSHRAAVVLPFVDSAALDRVAAAAEARRAREPSDRTAKVVLDAIAAQRAAVGSPPALHLQFPKAFLPQSGGIHPTNEPATGRPQRFGGPGATRCPLCAEMRHHLLTLDPVPEGLGVSLARLELETCLACCGWLEEVSYHHHGDDGRIDRDPPQDARDDVAIDRVTELAATEVVLVDRGPRWRHQPWSGDQNIAKVGGAPTWIEEERAPECHGCGEPMRFLAQFPSSLPQTDGAHFAWGSGGLGYVHWCDACRHSAWSWQARG